MTGARSSNRQPLTESWPAAVAAAIVAILVLAGCRGKDERDWRLEHTYQLGMEAMAKGQWQKAEKAFRKVLASSPGHLGARLKLARVLESRYRQRKDPRLISEALELAEEAVRRHPEDTGALDVLAGIQRAAGKKAEALRTRLKLADIAPGDAINLLRAARLAEATGKAKMAEEMFQRAGKLGSEEAAIELAGMLERRGDLARARKILESVGPESSTYKMALSKLGEMAARRGNFGEVRRIYEKIVKADPQDADAWHLLAAVNEDAGKLAEAEQQYRRALALDGNMAAAWVGLARCLLSSGKNAKEADYALRQADRLVARQPGAALELALLIEKELKRPDWARAVLGKALVAARAGGDAKLAGRIESALSELGGVKGGGGEENGK